ncbi:hypothetical protein BH11PAT4_BH11PAT4_8830 [soil metagenome]
MSPSTVAPRDQSLADQFEIGYKGYYCRPGEVAPTSSQVSSSPSATFTFFLPQEDPALPFVSCFLWHELDERLVGLPFDVPAKVICTSGRKSLLEEVPSILPYFLPLYELLLKSVSKQCASDQCERLRSMLQSSNSTQKVDAVREVSRELSSMASGMILGSTRTLVLGTFGHGFGYALRRAYKRESP